eukprot:GFKZ01003952.1.p1 GENE.GFKZ01003952.1~~GFKZ01003952.1.p1  ORF type:complete len:1483 (-),score=240.72 GFKZ01003952.1:648-5096(-)
MASRVGKYLLFETLGEGAFGKVKLGVHEESGEQVAVKIMDKSDIKAQEMTMNVRREIAIMKALKHRNIVNLRQVLTSQSKLYIVMDLVTGGELFTKILNEGKLEEKIARRYFQQLVDGIEYCHRRGVCHRDLKPENLLIDETTGELKITDFGLSAMKGASTTEELLHTQCGSPNYCAPEIIARHKQGYNGNKVDAWSCGIILFALLAGFLPFYDENTKVLYRMIQRDDVKFPKKFPLDARDLVLRLLHKEPEKRFTLAEVKKHRWFAIDYDGDDSVPRSGGSGASPPPSRRRRRGHSRKSSVDQAPRSREMVARKKSDRSDFEMTGQGVAPRPPTAPPPAPSGMPILIDPGYRSQIPPAHRPPAPPAVTPPKPRSPLPPAVRQSPPTAASHVLPSPPQQTPLPPLPPPTVPPPPSYPISSASRPVPPYPGSAGGKRTGRNSRDVLANEYGSAEGRESPRRGNSGNSISTSAPVPKFPSDPVANVQHHQQLPPFPAPEVRAENMGVFSPSTLNPAERYSHLPNGVSPSPSSPVTFSPASTALNSNGLRSPEPVSYGESSGKHEEPQGLSRTDKPPQKSTDLVSSSQQMISADNSQKLASADISNTGVAQPHSRGGRAKWTVTGPVPPPSYAQSTMAPVTTPSAVASGDASWMKTPQQKRRDEEHSRVEKPQQKQRYEDHASQNRSVKFENELSTEQEEKLATKEESQPVSLVARRRMLFHSMASNSQVPPPLPDSALQSSSGAKESPSLYRDEPKSAPLPRFADRMESPVKSRYPMTEQEESIQSHELATPITGEAGVNGSDKEPAYPIRNASKANSDFIISYGSNPQNEASGEPFAEENVSSGKMEEEVEEEAHLPQEGDTLQAPWKGSDSVVLHRDEDVNDSVPLKQRLAAAVARYRRIFKLGNNIGITASPSFSSNKGGVVASEGSGEDDKEPSTRAEFFARAKAVTGAWGIILTQELNDDSDSEEESVQVTETELEAFSRLLDFWDNRRASATIPRSGEIILDDDKSSPLSEEDILSIQSLLQKLEPKQVEDEMTEIEAEVDEVAALPSGSNSAPDMNRDPHDIIQSDPDPVTDINADYKAGNSNGRFGTSDTLSGTPSHDGSTLVTQTLASTIASTTASAAPPPPPPPPPPMPSAAVQRIPNSASVPPPPPPPPTRAKQSVAAVVPVDQEVRFNAIPSAPTPPPPPQNPANDSQVGKKPPPPPPLPPLPSSPYKRPNAKGEAANERRIVITESTVLDPYRPVEDLKQPGSPHKAQGSEAFNAGKSDVRYSDIVKETSAAMDKGARIPQRLSRDVEVTIATKRKSSNTASDADAEARKTLSHDSTNPLQSRASAASDGSGSGAGRRKGHRRSPSRDEHATRGMFTLGMFSRRKSTLLTSFESELAPERCLIEIGRILTGLGCVVLMKRGESKMKCEAPVKQEKLLVSITCTQERKVTTINFKRGRRDRSQIDAKEFLDFFHRVRNQFQERIAGDSQSHN